VRDAILAPQPAYDIDAFTKPTHAFRHRYAEGGELLWAVTQPDPKHKSATGHYIHKGADFRKLDRIVQWQQDQVGADPNAFRYGGHLLEQGQLWEVVEPGRDVMLASPDRIEAEAGDQPSLLKRFRHAARRIFGLWMLRIEIDTELHRLCLPLSTAPTLPHNQRGLSKNRGSHRARRSIA
jgi:hypothetical protein